MQPALSVILLTTLIGAAQGLYLALFTVQSYALVGLLPAATHRDWVVAGSVLVLVLLAAGLVASFFHLGRPERAWRTATQWRSSWLSREVIVLPAFMGVVVLYGATQAAGFTPEIARLPGGLVVDLGIVLGTLGMLLAFALFVCTAMIYASLRFLAEWHTPLTLVNYTLLGGASGFTLATALAAWVEPVLVGFLSGWAIVLTLLAGLSNLATLWRNARLQPKSTLQTAIGIKHPVIAQKSQGFMGGSFNTREFFHGRSAATVNRVRQAFPWLAFALPVALLAAGRGSASLAALAAAFAVQYLGLLAERWHFFAQARHPQNLYYQAAS